MTKAELRKSMKGIRDHYSREEVLAYGEAIRRRLIETELWRKSRQIFTYLSFGSEVDTEGLVKEAFFPEKGKPKEVYVPRVEGKSMNFYLLTENGILQPSSFGVPEPVGDCLISYILKENIPNEGGQDEGKTLSDREETAACRLMIIPGLAFDISGNRIGYGAGYYDRYLRAFPEDHFVKVGLAYEFQLMMNIPAEDQDVRMDYILTPERMIKCRVE